MRPLSRWLHWRPSRVKVVAGALLVLGFALTSVDWGFVAICALGAFGPGILRELGWLRDQDEFQRRAAQRAGYHAYLVTGFVAFLLLAYTRSGDRQLEHAEELSTLFLALLWFTQLFSSLFSYWGPHKTAFRILLIFGGAWGVFNILGNLESPVGMLMQLLVTTAPFFLLAYAARRWPKVAGTLLLAVSVALFWFFYLRRGPGGLSPVVIAGVTVLLLGPMILSGIALLRAREDAGVEAEG